MNQTFERIDGSFQTRLKDCSLLRHDRMQHIISRILARGRSANADLNPDELRRSQSLDHGLDTVMATMAPSAFDAQPTRRQIKIVVDKNHFVRRDL